MKSHLPILGLVLILSFLALTNPAYALVDLVSPEENHLSNGETITFC